MSFDLAVWAEDAAVTTQEAEAKYRRLCAGDRSGLVVDGRVEAFCVALLGRFPEAADVADGDVESYPWASGLDMSAGHALLPITRSRAAEVAPVVYELAAGHELVCFDPQAQAVHHPPGLQSAGQLRLSMADGSVLDHPDALALRNNVGRLSPANWYAILEREPEHYLQVGLGRNAGVPDGRYALEHRDGSADRHYRCVVTDLGEVVEAFVSFAGGLAWADQFAWQRVAL
jgi:hypothetical protein